MSKQSWWTRALGGRRPTTTRRAFRPRLEVFEDRLTPALSDPFQLTGDAAPAPAAGQQQDTRIAAWAGGFLTVWVDDRSATAPIPNSAGSSYFGEGLGSLWDIYAARLDAAGNVVDKTPIVVTQAEFYQSTPRVAFNGQNWLVAWQTEREGDRYKSDVMAVRVAPDGKILDQTPILISAGQTSDDRAVWDVASDGTNWVVTWRGLDSAAGVFTIEGARVGPDGTVLDPNGKTLRHDTWNSSPTGVDIAFAGDEYLMTWTESSSTGALKGQLLTAALEPIGGVFTINASGQRPAVATNGTDFLVTYIDYPNGPSWAAAVHGKRVSHAGQVLDATPIPIAPDAGYMQLTRVDAAWDGSVYVVTFEREALGTYNLDVFTAHVAATGQVYNPGGKAVVSAANHQTGPSVAPRAGGGVQVVWTDNRTGVADVRTASMSGTWAASPDQPVALGAPRQTSAVSAAGSNGFLSVFTSEIEGASRVLAQRLDPTGKPMDAEPVQLGTGGRPAVAWNEAAQVYMATWTSGGQVLGRRMAPTGAVLDAAPVFLMNGGAPDVAALGGQFLVTADFRESPQIQYTRGIRVGSNGQPVGTPVRLGLGFDVNPRVEAVGSRWLVVWEQNPTHDNPASRIAGAFVNPDGTTPGQFYVSDTTYPAEDAPDIASSGDTALVVWEFWGTSTNPDDIVGRRITADGTFVDPVAGILISGAPNGQFAPRAAWNGTEFAVTWIDQRNEGFPSQPQGDVYATHLGKTGPVADPAGFAVAASAGPEDTPSVAAGHGITLFGYSSFVEAGPYANLRVTQRSATEFPATQPAPGDVGSLTATAVAYDAIDLSWSAVAGADQYVIERSPNGTDGWARIGWTPGTQTTVRDMGLTFGTTYFYRVRATNLAGDGGYSPVASATTFHLDPPATPAGLDATAVSGREVRLTWTDVATETRYEVERSADGGATWSVVGVTDAANASVVSYSDTNYVMGGTAYAYRVRAYNPAGFGGYSNTDVVTPPLGAPTGVTATAFSSSQINLAWSGVSGAAGYKVERSANGTDGWSVVGTTAAGVTTYSNTGLVASTTYHYRVRAFTPTMDGDASSVVNATTHANRPPAAPGSLTATALSDTQVRLAWSNVTGETGFYVWRSRDGRTWTRIATTAADATTFTDTGLRAKTLYYYRVQAFNAVGASAFSPVVKVTTLRGR
jgi:Fibronectin type III domain